MGHLTFVRISWTYGAFQGGNPWPRSGSGAGGRLGKRGRFTEVPVFGSGAVQSLLEMLVFSPINNAIAIVAGHQ